MPNPRPFAHAAVVAATAAGGCGGCALARSRAPLLAAAFVVHAFFVLGVGVHEHHMMLAVPLLASPPRCAARSVPLFYVVSAIVALNMNLFYGIGMGLGCSVPRLLLGLDLTVILSSQTSPPSSGTPASSPAKPAWCRKAPHSPNPNPEPNR